MLMLPYALDCSAIRRPYRHRVKVELPWNGLGARYTSMLEWIRKREIPHGTESTMDMVTFCSPDALIGGDFVRSSEGS